MSDNETPREAPAAGGGVLLDGNLGAPHWTPPVRLIARLQPELANWFQPDRRYSEDECFFPYPHITFLVDKPTNLVCQICRDSVCQLQDFTTTPSTAPSPSCHAACLRIALPGRVAAHAGPLPGVQAQAGLLQCRHRVPAKLITPSSIHFLPRTLPDEGAIRPECSRCLEQEQVRQAKEAHNSAVYEFRQSTRRFAWSGHSWDEEAIFPPQD